MLKNVKCARCVKCGKEYEAVPNLTNCECGGILDIIYDYDYIKANLTKEKLKSRPNTMWRYRELLPVEETTPDTPLRVGWSPLYEEPKLAELLGIKKLWVKDDGINPTASLKDRASILPAGHNPNGAYWFDDATGRFITSTYYMDKLPQWVRAFNDKHLPERYLSADWNTLYPKATYAESTADDTPYENGIREGVKPMLPLPLPALYRKYGYGIIRNTPFGNTLTLDLARAAIEGEQLGSDEETDLLAISCSCTDYIGHQTGTHAIETEDTYLRLDQALADFLAYLDQKVGRGNYLVFLTADHGAMNNARFLQDRRIPADSWDSKAAARKLREALAKDYPQTADLIKTVMNYQVFLNVDAIRSARLNASKVKERVVSLLQQDPDVLYACDMEKVATASIPDEVKYRIINGYNRERSGSVAIVLKPNHYDHGMKGTDHGTWNPYDTHIPLVFMGWGIQHGSTTRPTYMTDIAPTIAALLHVQAPNGNIGRPIFGAEQ